MHMKFVQNPMEVLSEFHKVIFMQQLDRLNKYKVQVNMLTKDKEEYIV
jgi:hypothetical protein